MKRKSLIIALLVVIGIPLNLLIILGPWVVLAGPELERWLRLVMYPDWTLSTKELAAVIGLFGFFTAVALWNTFVAWLRPEKLLRPDAPPDRAQWEEIGQIRAMTLLVDMLVGALDWGILQALLGSG